MLHIIKTSLVSFVCLLSLSTCSALVAEGNLYLVETSLCALHMQFPFGCQLPQFQYENSMRCVWQEEDELELPVIINAICTYLLTEVSNACGIPSANFSM